ncbi:MAG: 30S ribosomal protein S16 [Nocardioidaceae bacterium]
MAVKIRLKRMGKIRQPYYRIVVADSRTKRDGRVIEEIGKYHPKLDPSLIEVDSERALHWLSVGAQPSEPVRALLRKTGDWQKYKGEPAPPPLLVAAPKMSKDERFNEALKEVSAEPRTEAVTTRTPRKRTEAPATPAPVNETAATEPPAVESPADESPAPEPPAPEPSTAQPAAAEVPADEAPAAKGAPIAEVAGDTESASATEV